VFTCVYLWLFDILDFQLYITINIHLVKGKIVGVQFIEPEKYIESGRDYSSPYNKVKYFK